jgi:hypothetical protein
MDSATLAVGPAFVGHHSTRTRLTALVAAVLLVLAMFVLVQQVDASPAGATVAAAASVVGADNAQLNFNQLFCSILISIRNAFAATPFAGFVTPILNSLIAGFGCAPS